jgi:hypothetical protein
MGEQSEQNALTIVQAAERLGLKPATVRMRYKRGKLDGFKKNGRIYVYLNKQGEQTEHQSEQSGEQNEQVDTINEFTIELQRTELTRVLRENERLNDRLERMEGRVDGLLASHAKERDREQVLRQQMQNQLDALAIRPALPPIDDALNERLQESEQNMGMLKTAVMQLVRFMEGKKAKS